MNWIDPFNSIQLFYAKILLCPCFCNSVFSFLVSHVTIKTRNIKEAICASDIAILSAQKHNFLTMSKHEFTMWLKVQFLNFSFSFCMTWYSAANKKSLLFLSIVCHFLMNGTQHLEEEITKCYMREGVKKLRFCEWCALWMSHS